MKTVNRFESNLLKLLYAIFQRAPVASVRNIIQHAHAQPACLSRNAVSLIQDALRKGSVHLLARQGGWQRRRHLRSGQVKEGRLWERTNPGELGLTFSRHSLAFLVWTTAVEFDKPELPLRLNLAELTIGDQWLLFAAYEAFRSTEFGPKLRSLTAWASNALCWLMYPDDAANEALPESVRTSTDENCNFAPWSVGQGACLLEALQPRLTARWIEIDQSKKDYRDPTRTRLLGRIQEDVLERFHRAIDSVNRRDLAVFELAALQALVSGGAKAVDWTRNLDVRGLRMADRQIVLRSACAFLEQANVLRRWEREARTVGFFEDEYPAAQLWQTHWERYEGDATLARANALIREIEPLHT